MKFRKKPVVIEAMQFTGDNGLDVCLWAHRGGHPQMNAVIRQGLGHLVVRTMEGEMHASAHDWIIKGVKGEFYPCKPDIFAATYEPAE